MAVASISQLRPFINPDLAPCEQVEALLVHAEALAEIALGDDFLGRPPYVLREYLHVLYELVYAARQLQEGVCQKLVKARVEV